MRRMEKIAEWVKTCLHKARFHSEYKADRRIDEIKKKDNVTLYKYYCPHCSGWHLTKKER